MAPILAMLCAGIGLAAAQAQDDTIRHPRTGRHTRVAAAPEAPITYRGLTINRTPYGEPDDSGDARDIYRDGPIRYNDIRDFSPAPYTTSGVQYPYGLDGIGGYGSDLGFGAGQDTADYDRGAGTRP